MSVRKNPRKNKLDRNGQIRIRLRFLRGPHIWHKIMQCIFFCKRQTWFTKVKKNSEIISQKSGGGGGGGVSPPPPPPPPPPPAPPPARSLRFEIPFWLTSASGPKGHISLSLPYQGKNRNWRIIFSSKFVLWPLLYLECGLSRAWENRDFILRFATARGRYGYIRSKSLPVTSPCELQYGFPAVASFFCCVKLPSLPYSSLRDY